MTRIQRVSASIGVTVLALAFGTGIATNWFGGRFTSSADTFSSLGVNSSVNTGDAPVGSSCMPTITTPPSGTSATTTIAWIWPEAIFTQSNCPGILKYVISVGTSSGASDVVSDATVFSGAAPTYTHDTVAAQDKTYYASLYAISAGGVRSPVVNSSGLRVDRSAEATTTSPSSSSPTSDSSSTSSSSPATSTELSTTTGSSSTPSSSTSSPSTTASTDATASSSSPGSSSSVTSSQSTESSTSVAASSTSTDSNTASTSAQSTTAPASSTATSATTTAKSPITTTGSSSTTESSATAEPSTSTAATETSPAPEPVVVNLDTPPAEPTVLKPQQPLVVRGMTNSKGQIVVFYLYSEPKMYTTTSGDDGSWSVEVPASDLTPGDHHVEVEIDSQPRQQVLAFSVADETGVVPAAPEAAEEATIATQTIEEADRTQSLLLVVLGLVGLLVVLWFATHRAHHHFTQPKQ